MQYTVCNMQYTSIPSKRNKPEAHCVIAYPTMQCTPLDLPFPSIV